MINLHWALVDDYLDCSVELNSLLRRLGIPYINLSCPFPDTNKDLTMGNRPRGVSGKGAGIQWALNHHKESLNRINDQNLESKILD